MKVKSLLFAAFAALSMTAFADGTAEKDGVVIDNCTAKVGETIDLTLRFETQTPYAAAQADITLPEGLDAVKIYDEDAEEEVWFVMLSNKRWKKSNQIASNNPGGTTKLLRYVIFDLGNKTFAAGKDGMLKMRAKVSKEGELKGTVTKVHWSTGIPDGVGDGDGFDSEFIVTATASGVNDITATGEVKARKVIENGQIYIIAGDKKYNVMGAQVK